jgi:hypothetical protein
MIGNKFNPTNHDAYRDLEIKEPSGDLAGPTVPPATQCDLELFTHLTSKPSCSLTLTDLYRNNKILIIGENHSYTDHHDWLIQNARELKDLNVKFMSESIPSDLPDTEKFIYASACSMADDKRLNRHLSQNGIPIIGLEESKVTRVFAEISLLRLDLTIAETSKEKLNSIDLFASRLKELSNELSQNSTYPDSKCKYLVDQFISANSSERKTMIDKGYLSELTDPLFLLQGSELSNRHEVNPLFAARIKAEFENDSNAPILAIVGSEHICDFYGQNPGILSELNGLPVAGIIISPQCEKITYGNYLPEERSHQSKNNIIQVPISTFMDDKKARMHQEYKEISEKTKGQWNHPEFLKMTDDHTEQTTKNINDNDNERKAAFSGYIKKQKNSRSTNSYCTVS